jgi:rhodanese-related sulfurtransferase
MFQEFLSENIIWVIAFIVVANMLIFSFFQGKPKGVKDVGVLELPQLQRDGNSVIIDVCEPAEFNKGHIPNAVNYPVKSLEGSNKNLMKLKNKTVILACATGSRSSKAAKILKTLGFENLHVLKGGMMSWNKENLPISVK